MFWLAFCLRQSDRIEHFLSQYLFIFSLFVLNQYFWLLIFWPAWLLYFANEFMINFILISLQDTKKIGFKIWFSLQQINPALLQHRRYVVNSKPPFLMPISWHTSFLYTSSAFLNRIIFLCIVGYFQVQISGLTKIFMILCWSQKGVLILVFIVFMIAI